MVWNNWLKLQGASSTIPPVILDIHRVETLAHIKGFAIDISA
jgi:hypothetical protein